MIFHNEKQLLRIIKYSPSIFIISISLIILSIQFIENKHSFEKEKIQIKQEFINKQKNYIKQRVYEVYDYVQREKISTEEQLKKSLQTQLLNAQAIAQTIYNNNKNQSEPFIKKLILDALRNIRFNEGRGYFFIYEKSGKNLLLPYNPELEGTNFWNHQDAKGTYIIQDMTQLLSQSNEAFYEWYWFNPNNPDVQRKKIGMIQNFEPFDWLIGTGEYVEDFEKKIQEKVLKNIREIRYSNNGYIFVIDYDSIYLSHIRKNFIGKNAVTNQDTVNIKNVIKEIIDISKNGEGFYSYTQNKKPDTQEAVKKISFVKGLNDWQWVIGTGFYEDDVHNQIQKRKDELDEKLEKHVYDTIHIALLLTLFLLLLSIYFSKILQKKFSKYREEIETHILNNTQQQTILAQQSKMAAMGEMIGNIAHQWRQPLSCISTIATGMKLQKEMDMLEDSFLKNGLTEINNSAQFLSNTIDDFRNFFKKDKKKKELSLQKTVDKAISLVYTQFHTMSIEIIKNSEDVLIKNYENELIQVLINILNNAKDELIKKDSTFQKMIFIKILKEKNGVLLQIKDNAGGIPKDIVERVFEPYFTTKHQSQGTGIGLYMSREIIVKNMNGEITVANVEYTYKNLHFKGAAFEIWLPLDIK